MRGDGLGEQPGAIFDTEGAKKRRRAGRNGGEMRTKCQQGRRSTTVDVKICFCFVLSGG